MFGKYKQVPVEKKLPAARFNRHADLLGWIKFKIQTAIKEAMIQAYTTELTIEQYQLLDSLLPPEAQRGRPRTVNMMLALQGILYILVSGCAWRLMPKEYPPYSTVYYYFSKWRKDGSWKQIHDRLGVK